MKFKDWINILIGVVITMTLLGFSANAIDKVIPIFINLAISALISEISGQLVVSAGGKFLKQITLTFEIWKLKFSFTVFAVAVFIVGKLIY